MTDRQKALLTIILVAILWGSAGAVGKLLIKEAHPFVVVFYRFAGSTVIILPFFLMAKKPKRWFLDLLPLGFFNAINVLFYYSGLAKSTANTGALLGAGVPLLTALLSWVFIKESISPSKMTGIILGLLGCLLIILVPVVEAKSAFGTDLIGNLYFVASTFAWTFYIIRSRSSALGKTYSAIVATFVNFFMCTLMAFIVSIATNQSLYVPAFSNLSFVGLYIYAVLGVTVITFLLFQWAVQHVTATTASLKEYLQLVIGIGINAAVLGEWFTPVFLIGSILIVIGVMVATGQRLSSKILSLRQARQT